MVTGPPPPLPPPPPWPYIVQAQAAASVKVAKRFIYSLLERSESHPFYTNAPARRALELLDSSWPICHSTGRRHDKDDLETRSRACLRNRHGARAIRSRPQGYAGSRYRGLASS